MKTLLLLAFLLSIAVGPVSLLLPQRPATAADGNKEPTLFLDPRMRKDCQNSKLSFVIRVTTNWYSTLELCSLTEKSNIQTPSPLWLPTLNKNLLSLVFAAPSY
jgi:hypothetical protein